MTGAGTSNTCKADHISCDGSSAPISPRPSALTFPSSTRSGTTLGSSRIGLSERASPAAGAVSTAAGGSGQVPRSISKAGKGDKKGFGGQQFMGTELDKSQKYQEARDKKRNLQELNAASNMKKRN